MKGSSFRSIAIIATIVACAPLVRAQTDGVGRVLDAGGSDRRESQLARRDREDEATTQFRDRATTVTSLFRLIPSTTQTDGASRYGGGLNFVVDTADDNRFGGLWSTTLRGAYRTHRPRAAEQNHFNSGTLGADVQVSRNDFPLGAFTVSGDYASVQDHYNLGSTTLEWDYNFKSSLQNPTVATLVGLLGYAHFSPLTGTAVNAFVPGLEFDYNTRTTTNVTLIADYTFKNDVDGEDDYAVSMRFKPAASTALRIGGGKHGRVFVSLTQTLTK
jgi:hypothetical protein